MKTLFVMVGISGSGKSEFAKKIAATVGIKRISSDDIRAELCGDATDQSQNDRVFQTFWNRIRDELRNERSVIADATSKTPKERKQLRKIALENGAQVIAVVMCTELSTCKQMNAQRERIVPEHVIDNQHSKLTIPTLDEVSEVWAVDWQQNQMSCITLSGITLTTIDLRYLKELYGTQN